MPRLAVWRRWPGEIDTGGARPLRGEAPAATGVETSGPVTLTGIASFLARTTRRALSGKTSKAGHITAVHYKGLLYK